MHSMQAHKSGRISRHAAVAIACLAFSLGGSAALKIPPGVVVPEALRSRNIEVLAWEKGPSGLNIWHARKAGKDTVFMTTPDNAVLLSGIAWDAKSGVNLSDAWMPGGEAPAKKATEGRAAAVPPEIEGINRLNGFVEGRGSLRNTLFVLADPRCPHSRALYAKTRTWVAQGGTIKWLPVGVISAPMPAAPLVEEFMRSGKEASASFAKVMSGAVTQSDRQPSPATLKTLRENQTYFYAVFQANKGKPGVEAAGVPTVFFVNARGEAEMHGSADDDEFIARVTRELKP